MVVKKVLIIVTCIASLGLSACSITEWSLVHRIDVQQGNVITQEMIDQLEPGMTRRQVQFVAGSPMVADVFHQNRWDYLYHMKRGNGEITREHVSLYFEDDALVRISGTMRPQEDGSEPQTSTERVTLVVPPQERVPPGLISRFWHWITFRQPDEVEP